MDFLKIIAFCWFVVIGTGYLIWDLASGHNRSWAVVVFACGTVTYFCLRSASGPGPKSARANLLGLLGVVMFLVTGILWLLAVTWVPSLGT